MAEKWPRFLGPRPSWQFAWTVNWVDRLHTSADKRMWPGRRAVVMVRWAAVGCGCSALIRHSSWTGNWAAGHEGYPPPNCSGQGEGQSFLAWCWASHAVAAAPSFRRALRVFLCTFCMRVCVYVYVCMCADKYIYIYVHVCMYMYMYAFIHVCVCMCMHICA